MLEAFPKEQTQCQLAGPAGFSRTIRIVGMARSGNHAIINWILDQLPGRWCFFNCIDPKSSPLQTARPLDDGRTRVCNCEVSGGTDGETAATLLFSLEDTFLGPALGEQASQLQGIDTGADGGFDLLILRDPYNLMASRRRLGWSMVTDKAARRIWKQHAKAFLGDISFSNRTLIPINYNAWLSRRHYRAGICQSLGLDFTDTAVDVTSACAGGSSFDGLKSPDRDRLLARWRFYRDDPEYWAMIDDEMAALAQTIFGISHPLAGEGLR